MPLVAVLGGLASLVVVTLIAMITASGPMADSIATAAGSAVILGIGLVIAHHLTHHERRLIFAIKASPPATLATGVVGGVAMLIGSALIISVGTHLDSGLSSRVHGIASPLGPGLAGTLITMLGVMVLAPLGEELLFRGILLRGLVQRMPFWSAALVSGAIFGACHADVWIYLFWPRFLALVGVGVALAWLNRTRGYWCGVTAHATLNTVATLALLLAR